MTSGDPFAGDGERYYRILRVDLLPLFSPGIRSLLDVGCGNGESGLAIKRRFDIPEVVGIEYDASAAKIAATKLDTVLCGDIENLPLPFPPGHFDCILCADILEHTRNPWEVLKKLHLFLSDSGVLIVSLPNLRHIVPIVKIIFNRFAYEEVGILDKSHLRFFTPSTMRSLIEGAGFTITRTETNRSTSWKFQLLNICSFGLLHPFSVFQYKFVAQKKISA